MSASSPVQARNRVAALSRSRTVDDPDLIDAKRTLATANIAAAIGRELAGEVELTEAQTAELVSILRGGQR